MPTNPGEPREPPPPPPEGPPPIPIGIVDFLAAWRDSMAVTSDWRADFDLIIGRLTSTSSSP